MTARQATDHHTRTRRRSRWAQVRRILGIAFVALVVVLVVRKLAEVEWAEVWVTLQEYDYRTLTPAALLVVLSYFWHSAFDLLGRWYARHRLSSPRVLVIAFVSYAFNLNLGALVGGLGIRYRLYSGAGLSGAQIASVYTIGVVSNWIGYLALLGAVLAARTVVLPPEWGLNATLLQIAGFALLAVVAAYLVACARARRRRWTVRGHAFHLPPLRFAVMQCALSITNWLTISAIIQTLLPSSVPLLVVLGVVLIGSIAGAVAHIPAGLGVLETVFVVLLGDRVPHHALLAALLAYRAMYYLLPMLPAVVGYFLLEARGRRASTVEPTA
ncbi:lysylphosphatidylglycerol synthase domain-containing protein [Cupriavidus gilardii]|uniref:lysylphosphatidylglycerol synthase domain-containing protein n=1 Tax=Cupriavidus gilardii TaxID=82541 RepID=UPI0030B80741